MSRTSTTVEPASTERANPRPNRRRPRRKQTGGTPPEPPERLWKTRVRDIWKFLKAQPASFWLINFYLFIEYVRPQSVYPAIDVLPWAQLAVLGSLAAVILEGRVPWLRGGLSRLYAVFLMIVILSGVAAWRPGLAWANISLPVSWFLIFLLIVNTVDTERRFFVFVLAFLLYSTKMSQHGARSWIGTGFGFRDWGATGGPGWFQNSGEFGIQMCVFLPLAVYFILGLKKYWPRWKLALFALMPITALMSVVASSSRGALIGSGLVIAWMVVRSRHRVKAGMAAAVVTAVVIFVIPDPQMERLDQMGEDGTSVHRLTMWEDGIEIANAHPLLGIGFENWGPYYQVHYGRGLPHNIFVEAGAELGYLGLACFLALIVGTFVTNRKSRKLASRMGERGRFLYHMGWGLDGALVGYIGSGFFVTVLHYPYFWINLAMTVSLQLAVRRKLAEVGRPPSGVVEERRSGRPPPPVPAGVRPPDYAGVARGR